LKLFLKLIKSILEQEDFNGFYKTVACETSPFKAGIRKGVAEGSFKYSNINLKKVAS